MRLQGYCIDFPSLISDAPFGITQPDFRALVGKNKPDCLEIGLYRFCSASACLNRIGLGTWLD